MKKFSIPCIFGGQKSTFVIYVGEPKIENHPLQHQANWLSKERGGTIPQEIMDSAIKLRDLAIKHNVSFEDVFLFAVTSAQSSDSKIADNQDLIEDIDNVLSSAPTDEQPQDSSDGGQSGSSNVRIDDENGDDESGDDKKSQ